MPDEIKRFPVAGMAPPMTADLLRQYKKLTADQPAGAVKDAMTVCLAAVKAWWDLPETDEPVKDEFTVRDMAQAGKTVTFGVRPLPADHQKQLSDLIPWKHELDGMTVLFSALPDGTREVSAVVKTAKGESRITKAEVFDQTAFDLKKAATHLLWHAIELELDREPLTQEVLGRPTVE